MNKTKLFLYFSLVSFIQILKNMDTWIYFFTLTSIAGFFFRQPPIIIGSLFLILFLSILRDFTSPSFKHYAREKQGIPNKGDIRRLKQKYKYGEFRRIQQAPSGEGTSPTTNFAREKLHEQYAGSEGSQHSSEEQNV